MPLRDETPFSKSFYHQLTKLREKTAIAPLERQAELTVFADRIEQLHRQTQASCARVSDSLDDLSLFIKSATFNAWADHTP